MSIRLGALLVAINACTPNHATISKRVTPIVCPTLHADSATLLKARMGDTTAINALRQRAEFTSVVIDGSVAYRNRPMSSMSDYVSPFNPPINPGELKSVRLADAVEAERYGSCLGVPWFVVETKAGNWRPAER